MYISPPAHFSDLKFFLLELDFLAFIFYIIPYQYAYCNL